MVQSHEAMKEEMEKAYPGYTFLDAEVKYNKELALFYIYARLIKHGSGPKKAACKSTKKYVRKPEVGKNAG